MKQDFTRTPNGSQRIIDYNLSVQNYLKLPVFSGTETLNGNVGDAGAIGYISGQLSVYNGSSWNKITSVASGGSTSQYLRGGNTWQTLDTSVVPENGNLYYTATRFNTSFGAKSTTDLAQGTNLYYTNALVQTFSDARYLQISGGTLLGDVQQATSPVNGTSLINKNYVDNIIIGVVWVGVDCATTANITLSGEQTIDGITTSGSRVFVKNQTTQTQNGIYISSSGAWSRSSDASTGAQIVRLAVIIEGSTSAQLKTQWVNTNSSITLGSTNITFIQSSGIGTYTNGTGILLGGTAFSLDLSYTDARYLGISAVAGGDLIGNYPNPTIKSSVALSGTPSTPSLAILGTGGNGYISLIAQSVNPTTPAVGTQNIYADASGRFSFMGSNGFSASFSKALLTASQLFSLPNASTTLLGNDNVDTVSNKRIVYRTLALSANSATPAVNTDNYDYVHITAQTLAITGFTMTGTPNDRQTIWISITGTTSVAITLGSSFEASGGVALSTTTVGTARLDMGFIWNTETSKWRQIAVA